MVDNAALRNKTGNPPRQGAGSGEPGTAGLRREVQPLLMFDSKKAVSRMLHEDMERQAVQRMVRQAQKEQMIPSKEKRKEQER